MENAGVAAIAPHTLWFAISIVGMITSARPLLATSVVVVLTKTQVVMAADSKIANWRQGRPTTFFVSCKIHVFSGLVGAVQGREELDTYTNEDRTVKWNAWGDLDYAMRKGKSVEEAVSIADRRLVNSIRRHRLDFVLGQPPPEKSYLSYAIAGIRDNGQAVVGERSFPPRRAGVTEPDGHIYAGEDGRLGVVLLGKHQAIDDYRRSHPDLSRGRTIVQIARDLVQVEIDAAPDDVGGPISVLVMDKPHGIQWSERGLCK